jgi:hypothetical protein
MVTVTVVPRSTMSPATGLWLTTCALTPDEPVIFGTRPTAWSWFVTLVAVYPSKSGTSTGAVGLWIVTAKSPAQFAPRPTAIGRTRRVQPAATDEFAGRAASIPANHKLST